MCPFAENPYEEALGGVKNLLPASYIGVYDSEAENCGLADKYEIEACHCYLWNHNMTIKPVGTDIVHASYRHHMGNCWKCDSIIHASYMHHTGNCPVCIARCLYVMVLT